MYDKCFDESPIPLGWRCVSSNSRTPLSNSLATHYGIPGFQNLLFNEPPSASTGDTSRPALPECPAGPNHTSVPGQEEAAGGNGCPAGPERGAGEEVSGLQEGAGWHLAPPGGDQVGGKSRLFWVVVAGKRDSKKPILLIIILDYFQEICSFLLPVFFGRKLRTGWVLAMWIPVSEEPSHFSFLKIIF